jgi:hypothetical protein
MQHKEKSLLFELVAQSGIGVLPPHRQIADFGPAKRFPVILRKEVKAKRAE